VELKGWQGWKLSWNKDSQEKARLRLRFFS
jgi:hypothetical protein